MLQPSQLRPQDLCDAVWVEGVSLGTTNRRAASCAVAKVEGHNLPSRQSLPSLSDFLFMSVAIAVQGFAGSHQKLLGICFVLLSFTRWRFVILFSCSYSAEAIVVVARWTLLWHYALQGLPFHVPTDVCHYLMLLLGWKGSRFKGSNGKQGKSSWAWSAVIPALVIWMNAPKRSEEAETPGHNLSNSSQPRILLLCRSVFARVQGCALVERFALQGGLSKAHLARVGQLAFLFLLCIYLPLQG